MSPHLLGVNLYLRLFFKRRLVPGGAVHLLRRNLDDIGDKMPRPPANVQIEDVPLAGIRSQAVTAPEAVGRRTLLYLHGGGYASGAPRHYRDLAWRLSVAARCRVVIPDYRLAPEHPFPAAIDDAAAAYQALLREGLAPDEVALAGDSAGGGLTLATLVKLRDLGVAMPAAAAVLSPWTDLAMTGASVTANRDVDPMIKAEAIVPTARMYLGDTPPDHPYASPLYADVRGLPPTLIHVGSTEVLLDDSRRMADRLTAAGVPVELTIYPKVPHVFHVFAPFIPEARTAIGAIGRYLDGRMRR